MRILALDLGKCKTAAFVLDRGRGERRHRTTRTSPAALHDLIVEVGPDRVVFEIGPSAGWLADIVRALKIELQVVNVAHEAWRWRNVRAKSDRLDAEKLAELSLMDQLSLVHVPERGMRQWRSLIAYRKQVVGRRTQVQNTIRAVLDRQGLSMPSGNTGWSAESLTRLREMAQPPKVRLDPSTIGTRNSTRAWLDSRSWHGGRYRFAVRRRRKNVAHRCDGR